MRTEIFLNIKHAENQGTDVGDESIVPCEYLVELSTSGNVLVVENQWGAIAVVGVEFVPEFFFDLCERNVKNA